MGSGVLELLEWKFPHMRVVLGPRREVGTKEWRQIVIVFPSWEAEKVNGSYLKIHQRSFGMDLGSEPL